MRLCRNSYAWEDTIFPFRCHVSRRDVGDVLTTPLTLRYISAVARQVARRHLPYDPLVLFSYRFIVETVSGYGVQACAVIRRGRRPRRPVKLRANRLCNEAQFISTIPCMASLTFRVSDDTLSINRGKRLPVFLRDKRCKRCKRDKRDKCDRRTVPLTRR